MARRRTAESDPWGFWYRAVEEEMGAYTRYRFISYGDPDELEARAIQIRDRFADRACWSEFVIRRISGTSLVVVVIDDPCEEIVEAFKKEQWQFGGRV